MPLLPQTSVRLSWCSCVCVGGGAGAGAGCLCLCGCACVCMCVHVWVCACVHVCVRIAWWSSPSGVVRLAELVRPWGQSICCCAVMLTITPEATPSGGEIATANSMVRLRSSCRLSAPHDAGVAARKRDPRTAEGFRGCLGPSCCVLWRQSGCERRIVVSRLHLRSPSTASK
jgi:hypothetical protein